MKGWVLFMYCQQGSFGSHIVGPGGTQGFGNNSVAEAGMVVHICKSSPSEARGKEAGDQCGLQSESLSPNN